jgi:4-diphosphocytidyl-2-C-methyl-D-erythritol kinase
MFITTVARAKINLVLDVLGKRPDGYHEVKTVMQSVALHDRLEFSPGTEGIKLSVIGSDLPLDETNLVYRAAELIRSQAGIRRGVNVLIKKNIPVAAGLGGGSADAAATLVALNKMWRTGYSLSELMRLGEQLGSDVPFCLLGGTALARGKGEQLTPLSPCPECGLVLVKPPVNVSTALVYRAFKPELIEKKPDCRAVVENIKNGNITGIANNLANALEPVTVQMHPQIAVIKAKLMAAGALGALMSGSGPTVFGLAPDPESARKVAARYAHTSELVLVTGFCNQGMYIE